jgi:transcriptional regulator with XRE-family HTH domain
MGQHIDFSQRLYKAMLDKGWRQAELSRQAGVDRHAISEFVRGDRFPTARELTSLSRALGVRPEDLAPDFVMPAAAVAEPPSGGRIYERMIQRNMTIKQLAEAAGMPIADTSLILRGHVATDASVLARLEAVLTD